MIRQYRKRGASTLLCLALLLSLLPAGTARAAAPTSLTVEGKSVIDLTQDAGDLSTLGWSYETTGSAGPVLWLIGFDGKEDISAEGDLTINAADSNYVGTLDVSGTLTITGTGILVVEEIKNVASVSVSGAALFVNDGSDRYVLQNNADMYDWAVLPAGNFVIPGGRTLALPPRAVLDPDSETNPDPELDPENRAFQVLSTAKLTLPEGGSLTVESGGVFDIQSFIRLPTNFPSALEMQGTLTVKNGGQVLNHGGRIDSDGGSILCESTGVIDCSEKDGSMGGYITLAEPESGAAVLALSMKGGYLELISGGGRFDGGVKLDGTHSIEVTNTNPDEVVTLDSITTSSILIQSYASHSGQAKKNANMKECIGRLEVTGSVECENTLQLESVEICTGSIRAGLLDIKNAALACAEMEIGGRLASEYAYLNLGTVQATTQIHKYGLFTAPTGELTDMTDSIYKEQDSPDTMYRHLFFCAYSEVNIIPLFARQLEEIPDVSYTWDGASPLTYAALLEEMGEPKTLTLEESMITPDYEEPEQGPGLPPSTFELTHFVLLGKDSEDRLRVWHVYPDSAAPDVADLYAVRAVNYYDRTTGISPAADEGYLQSDHSGSGVLGGGGRALCNVGVHSYSGHSCANCGSANPNASVSKPKPVQAAVPAPLPEPEPEPAPPPVVREPVTIAADALSGEVLAGVIDKLTGGTVSELVITGAAEDGAGTFAIPPALAAAVAAAGVPVTLDLGEAMLILSSEAMAGAGASEVKIVLQLSPALEEAQQGSAGGRPVFSASVFFGETEQALLAGTVTLCAKHTPREGEHFSGLLFRYINEDGTTEDIFSWYEDGWLYGTLPHFSVIAIAYDPSIVWENPFADVAQRSWYYPAVRHAFQNGLMQGVSAQRFAPDDEMSRAMFVTALYRLAGAPQVDWPEAPFADVARGTWYDAAVCWAAWEGITLGDGVGLFRPEQAITREQMIAILHRYEQIRAELDEPAALPFSDSGAVSVWAIGAMAWAADGGIINGYPDGTVRPQEPVTRGQVAQIMMNYLNSHQGGYDAAL